MARGRHLKIKSTASHYKGNLLLSNSAEVLTRIFDPFSAYVHAILKRSIESGITSVKMRVMIIRKCQGALCRIRHHKPAHPFCIRRHNHRKAFAAFFAVIPMHGAVQPVYILGYSIFYGNNRKASQIPL